MSIHGRIFIIKEFGISIKFLGNIGMILLVSMRWNK